VTGRAAGRPGAGRRDASASTRPELAAKAELLRSLHGGPEPLVLPNGWDVASAIAVERAGAKAVATTSSGVAATFGYPDGEAISAPEMLGLVARMAEAISVPLTADLEGGYGLPAADLVAGMVDAGAVGLNLEDTDRAGGGLLAAVDQAARIAAVRRAADDAGIPIVINARVDAFLRGQGSAEQLLDDAIARARAYLAAGADCVYPITLDDADAIGHFVREVEGPVNILLRPGSPSLRELGALGVRRVSVGGGLWRHAMRTVEEVARALLSGDDRAFAELGET
jgi:2-methylisocitrate lyase-like PEP mutase family enzyme